MTYIKNFVKINKINKVKVLKKCFLLSDRTERRYFSGVDIAEGYMLIAGEKYYFSDKRYFSALKEKLKNTDINPKVFTSLSSIKEVIDAIGVKTLYIDYDATSLSEYKGYKTLGVKIKDGTESLKKNFAVKSGKEIKDIKKACEIAQKSFYNILPKIKPPITERELKDILENEMIRLGASGVSFDTIVAFRENSAVPHHETGDTLLKENSVILIDFGCKVNGYCSDVTRTIYYGNPDKEFINNYNAVLTSNITAEEKITAGILGKEADAIARRVLEKEGLSEYFTHSLGHGVGLNIHEKPYLSIKSEDRLKNKNVFTVEPGVYFDGKYGIRIEDTVILEKGKVKRLFTDGKELIILK